MQRKGVLLRLMEFDQPAGSAQPHLPGVGLDFVDLIGGQSGYHYRKTADGRTVAQSGIKGDFVQPIQVPTQRMPFSSHVHVFDHIGGKVSW